MGADLRGQADIFLSVRQIGLRQLPDTRREPVGDRVLRRSAALEERPDGGYGSAVLAASSSASRNAARLGPCPR